MPKVTVNGIRINYEEAGAGEALILIHGLGFTRRHWALQVPVLSKYYRTMTPDCRGHGDSDKPAEQHTVRDLSEDLQRFMDRLCIGKAHVLGISMGGMVAQLFAADHPQKVNKLVLCDTRSRPNPAFAKRLLHQIETLDPAARAKMVFRDEITYPVPEDILRINQEDIERNPTDAYIRDLKAIMNFDATDRLKEIRAPTLIVVGDHDRLMDECRFLNRQIQGSRLAVISRAGHLSCLENPDEFNRVVLDFLRNQ